MKIGDTSIQFQRRVQDWMMECFSAEICRDRQERNHRFIEEALELVQACGCTAGEAHQLVDYVYGRGRGEINQEVGGVMVTLAALCTCNNADMANSGETELAHVWTKIEKIRAKQAGKPKHSPLPEAPLQGYGRPSDRIENLTREVGVLRARVTELLQFNNEFEERARKAERRCASLDHSLGTALHRIFELIEDQEMPAV